MPYRDIFIGTFFALKWIPTEEESEITRLRSGRRVDPVVLANSDMTAVTARIADRVAHLARQFVAMQVVHHNIGLPACDIVVASLTSWHGHPVIAVGSAFIVQPRGDQGPYGNPYRSSAPGGSGHLRADLHVYPDIHCQPGCRGRPYSYSTLMASS